MKESIRDDKEVMDAANVLINMRNVYICPNPSVESHKAGDSPRLIRSASLSEDSSGIANSSRDDSSTSGIFSQAREDSKGGFINGNSTLPPGGKDLSEDFTIYRSVSCPSRPLPGDTFQVQVPKQEVSPSEPRPFSQGNEIPQQLNTCREISKSLETLTLLDSHSENVASSSRQQFSGEELSNNYSCNRKHVSFLEEKADGAESLSHSRSSSSGYYSSGDDLSEISSEEVSTGSQNDSWPSKLSHHTIPTQGLLLDNFLYEEVFTNDGNHDCLLGQYEIANDSEKIKLQPLETVLNDFELDPELNDCGLRDYADDVLSLNSMDVSDLPSCDSGMDVTSIDDVMAGFEFDKDLPDLSNHTCSHGLYDEDFPAHVWNDDNGIVTPANGIVTPANGIVTPANGIVTPESIKEANLMCKKLRNRDHAKRSRLRAAAEREELREINSNLERLNSKLLKNIDELHSHLECLQSWKNRCGNDDCHLKAKVYTGRSMSGSIQRFDDFHQHGRFYHLQSKNSSMGGKWLKDCKILDEVLGDNTGRYRRHTLPFLSNARNVEKCYDKILSPWDVRSDECKGISGKLVRHGLSKSSVKYDATKPYRTISTLKYSGFNGIPRFCQKV